MPPEPQILTDALISEVATARGGWTREQLGIMGISWPPPKGWRKQLVAEERTLTDDEVEEVREARVTVAERRSRLSASERPVLPCPWCGVPVERVERGGHVRRFCPSTNHRSLYNSAMRRVALWYAELITTPGALQKWQGTKACTLSQCRRGATPPSQVSGHPGDQLGR